MEHFISFPFYFCSSDCKFNKKICKNKEKKIQTCTLGEGKGRTGETRRIRRLEIKLYIFRSLNKKSTSLERCLTIFLFHSSFVSVPLKLLGAKVDNIINLKYNEIVLV